MTIPRDKYIKIPIWLVSVVFPVIVAAMAGFITDQVVSAGDRKQIEVNTKKLDILPAQLDQKVDWKDFELFRAQINDMKTQMNRIEVKIDDHMKSD